MIAKPTDFLRWGLLGATLGVLTGCGGGLAPPKADTTETVRPQTDIEGMCGIPTEPISTPPCGGAGEAAEPPGPWCAEHGVLEALCRECNPRPREISRP